MKYKLLKYSLLSLLIMLCGSSYAKEVTLKYSDTSTTTNMTGENEATLLGLDATEWSVIGAKGSAANFPGLNKDGSIRMYYHQNGGNTITVQNLSDETINSITITYTGTSYSNASVTVNDELVEAKDGVYTINSTSFVIGNANTSNTQVRIKSILIDYGAEDTRATTTIEIGEATTSAEVGATITLPSFTVKAGDATVEGALVSWTSSNETVATIEDGQIKALAAGSTTITATYEGDETNYKGSTASFTLTVTTAPYKSFAALQADATTTSTPVTIQFNGQQVVFVNGNNAFLADSDGYGLLIYTKNHGLETGQVLNGTINCNLTIYQGNVEITNFSKGTLDITTATVTPVEKTIAEITKSNQSTLVTLKGVTYKSGDGTFSDGTNTIKYYDNFKVSPALVDSITYDVTGIVIVYNNVIEIAPRTADDVVATEEIEIKNITSLTELEEICYSGKSAVCDYTFSDLLVTYQGANHTYVTDGNRAMMMFGASGLKTGQRISGTIRGTAILYLGTPEFSIKQEDVNVSVLSSGNEVTHTTITAAQLQDDTKQYMSQYVSLGNVRFETAYTTDDYFRYLEFKSDGKVFRLFNLFNRRWEIKTNATYTLDGMVGFNKDTIEIAPMVVGDLKLVAIDEPVGFRDIKLDLTAHAELLTESNVYITVAEDGTIGTTDDAEQAAATIKGKAHGSYGSSNFTASVPVQGCVKITYATHDYGNDIVVTNSEGAEVAKFNTQGAKWMSDHNNVVVAYYRTNEPSTLSFSKANYNPYFAVEAIDEADLPAEVTNYAITFAAGEGVEGIAPAAIEVEAGSKFTAPANYTLYKEGYTLTGWTSGDAIYLPGQEITPEADMTLTAKFAENEVNLTDLTEAIAINFALDGYNNNPKYSYQGKNGIIVTQATVGGKAIDVKADVDATNGKFAHNGSGWHQVNTGTKVTVPSAKGATITVKTYNNANALKFGETAAEADADPASFTATADDATLVIEQTGNGYWSALTITLPAPEEEPAEESNVLFSWEGNADGAIVSGGVVTAADKDGTDITDASINIQSGAFYVIKIDGKSDFTSGNVVTITLDKELKAGDKIVITAFRNKDVEGKKSGMLAEFDKGGRINTATTGFEFVNINEAVKETSEYAAEPNTLEFEVPAAAAGSKVIRMTRAQTATNLLISKFVIISKESGEEPGEDPEEPVTDPVVLTWDYTEANIPNVGPDNGLYYGGYVNDAAGTNNGMHGVKLNGSGYAFFEKPAVQGTLTLTFGKRSGADAYAVNVYSCTIADGVATKGDLIGEVAIDATPGTGSIEIDKSVTGIYIERKTSSEGVLSKIVFKQFVPRTFVDFEITNEQLKGEFDATTLPKGVTFTGTQRNDTHGYGNVTLTVPVDGTVKFTIGGCNYANPATCKVTNAEGTLLAEPNLKTDKCYHQDGSAVTYIYTGEPTTLTFSNIAYLPYFKAEATEISEAIITYKDQNGKELGKKTVFEGDPIGDVPAEYEAQLTIPEGMKFRGWTYSNNVKIKATDIVNGDVTVKASVTAIEEAPTVGSIQTYNLTQATFYPEDHENFSIENGAYYNNHGFEFAEGGSFSVAVTSKAQIVLTLCQYGSGTTIQVVDAEGKVVRDDVPAKAEVDGGTAVVNYEGPAGLLKFTFVTKAYLHKVTVYNVSDFLTKDESGYYIVPAGDAAGLVMALNAAASEENAKIFLPNGTYDLGEATLTGISGKNVSLIGQSMTGVTIKNAPAVEMEGLGKADLFNNTAEGLYMQDLTLQNALDYYKAGTGRAVTLHDQGTKTVNKNVRHLSYQDTYYSHKVGGLYYFEGGEIHGTVDYLCGNGKVYFNEVKLVNEKRSSATISANSELYVFNNCTVENNADTYNLGRAWSDNPVCIYLNTTLLDPSKLVSTRWNLSGINCDYSIAGEYGTKDAAGTNITPEKNEVTFKKQNTKLNTILSADQAATYTIEYVLGDWAATAQAEAQQVEAPVAQFENGNIVWEAVAGATAYAIFKNDELAAITTETSFLTDDNASDLYTIRSANTRGGFGAAAEVTGKATSINAITVENDKQVIYNMQGMRVQKASKGLYIINGKKVVR